MIALGKTVRDRRQQLGLSQADLAKKAGTNAAIIDFIEKASFRGVDPVHDPKTGGGAGLGWGSADRHRKRGTLGLLEPQVGTGRGAGDRGVSGRKSLISEDRGTYGNGIGTVIA